MLTDSLLDAVPALLNHWMTPAPLSHRLINTATGHVLAPINLQSVLVMALALICILGLGWRLAAPMAASSRSEAPCSPYLRYGCWVALPISIKC